jgi:hypothetical protein
MGFVIVTNADPRPSTPLHGPPILFSPDGRVWKEPTDLSLSDDQSVWLQDVIYDGTRWVAVGEGSPNHLAIGVSQTANAWEFTEVLAPTSVSQTIRKLIWTGTEYLIFLQHFKILRSTDLEAWTVTDIPAPGVSVGYLRSAHYNPETQLFSIHRYGQSFDQAVDYAYSTNLIDWSWVSITSGIYSWSVQSAHGAYVSNSRKSTNGTAWVDDTDLVGHIGDSTPDAMAYGNDIWLATGSPPVRSTDGVSWSPVVDEKIPILGNALSHITFDDITEQFIHFASTGTYDYYLLTKDGATWESVPLMMAQDSPATRMSSASGPVGGGWRIGKIGLG